MAKYLVVITSQTIVEGDSRAEVIEGTKSIIMKEDFLPLPDGVTIIATKIKPEK